MKRLLIAPLLVAVLLTTACPKQSNFALSLRLALAASPAFFDSLNLGPKREAVITDFTDLSRDALTLSDELRACSNNPCRVGAVSHFQVAFAAVLARGHFKLAEKLGTVQRILQGIVDAARIFFGGGAAVSGPAAASVRVTEADIRAQIESLRLVTHP